MEAPSVTKCSYRTNLAANRERLEIDDFSHDGIVYENWPVPKKNNAIEYMLYRISIISLFYLPLFPYFSIFADEGIKSLPSNPKLRPAYVFNDESEKQK